MHSYSAKVSTHRSKHFTLYNTLPTACLLALNDRKEWHVQVLSCLRYGGLCVGALCGIYSSSYEWWASLGVIN